MAQCPNVGFYQDGGETELDNLLPVSAEWHHNIHDRGWTVKMGPDRALKIWKPNGELHRTIPAPTPITRQREKATQPIQPLGQN